MLQTVLRYFCFNPFYLDDLWHLQVTFYEGMKDLTEYGKRKYLPDSDLQVSNSVEGLVLGGLSGGMI